MKRVVLISAIATTLIATSGCATRLGQFTAASSQNVRNLQYTISDKTKQHAKGSSCVHQVLFFPIGDLDDRIQRAMDNAISNGRAAGADGDLLVNARIDVTQWSAFVYGQNCVNVEGDLVKLSKT